MTMTDPGDAMDELDTACAARASTIEAFAALLRALREAAGSPSYRDLAARSRAISHTTLHEAAGGARLPSWATTVEFVRACGGDPADVREQWEQANRVVRAYAAARPAARATESASVADELPDEAAVVAPAEVPAGVPSGVPSVVPAVVVASSPARRVRIGRRGRRQAAVVAALATTVLAGSGAAWLSRGDAAPEEKLASLEVPHELTAADCPVQQQNPPLQPNAHKGDEVVFVGDITLTDCTHIRRGAKVTKDWRFKNAGTVTWIGYTLRRVDLPQKPDQCQTFNDIPIGTTRPGEFVDVEVEVTAPPQAAFCFVRFKMVDPAGRVAFPGHRPVNFQVIVD
jgi:hypothetical protein